MGVMTHIAPPVYGCVVTPIITRAALCVIIFFGCCTYIINLSLNFSVFNYFESYDKQIRLAALEQVMERENENYRAIADSYAEIRNIKHDLKTR